MPQLWTLVVIVGVIAAVAIYARARGRRSRRDDQGLSMPRVEGFQVSGPLHPAMTRGCVFDLGLQYGRGFRRKEGPALPHGPGCLCRSIPFAFSGSEVFNGSLRRFAELRSSEPGFPQVACAPLLKALKRVNAEPIPDTLTGYLTLVGVVEDLTPEQQDAVKRFLETRYAYLRELPTAGAPEPSNPQPSGTV
jgi:hypothetical protein